MGAIVNVGGVPYSILTRSRFRSQLTTTKQLYSSSVDEKWSCLHHKLNTNRSRFTCLFSDNKREVPISYSFIRIYQFNYPISVFLLLLLIFNPLL